MAEIVSGADAELAERVNDLLLPIVKGVGSERAYQCLTESLQTSADPASCRTIRSSSTSATPRSTASTRAPPRSRRRTSSSARSRAIRAWHCNTSSRRSRSSGQRQRTAELADGRALLATALADVQAMTATLTGYLMSAQENARELYRLGLESVAFLLAVGDLLIGWLLLDTPRSR